MAKNLSSLTSSDAVKAASQHGNILGHYGLMSSSRGTDSLKLAVPQPKGQQPDNSSGLASASTS